MPPPAPRCPPKKPDDLPAGALKPWVREAEGALKARPREVKLGLSPPRLAVKTPGWVPRLGTEVLPAQFSAPAEVCGRFAGGWKTPPEGRAPRAEGPVWAAAFCLPVTLG